MKFEIEGSWGQYRWCLRVDGDIIAKGEGHLSKQSCINAINRVAASAGSEIDDLTDY